MNVIALNRAGSSTFDAFSSNWVELSETLVANGAQCDRTGEFPDKSLAELSAAGFGSEFSNRGWSSASVLPLMDALRFVGRADLSVGRIFEGHINALHLIAWYGTDAQKRFHHQRILEGAWYGVWATEMPPGVALDDGGILSGAKTFASGAGHIDYAIITALQTKGGKRRMIIVDAKNQNRADNSGWRVRGMRATSSGRYDLSDVTVSPDMMLGLPGEYDDEPRFTSGAWRFTAVQLGGIEALVAETRALMTDGAKADPLQRLKFAQAVEAMRSAYFWVRESAVRFAEGHPDAIPIARMTRGVVERAALEVMSLSARVIGTRSAFDGERVDKISRDLSLYLRQAGPDHARDQAALAWLDRDPWTADDRLW